MCTPFTDTRDDVIDTRGIHDRKRGTVSYRVVSRNIAQPAYTMRGRVLGSARSLEEGTSLFSWLGRNYVCVCVCRYASFEDDRGRERGARLPRANLEECDSTLLERLLIPIYAKLAPYSPADSISNAVASRDENARCIVSRDISRHIADKANYGHFHVPRTSEIAPFADSTTLVPSSYLSSLFLSPASLYRE